MTELIILDLYGTIIKSDERDGLVRDGFLEFLDFYKNKKRVVFSDGDTETIEADLQLCGLAGRFNGVYGRSYCVSEGFYSISNEIFKELLLCCGGGTIKNLERVCQDFSVSNSEAVFIGDNAYGRDLKSAEINGVGFIKIPQYRTKLPDWRERENNEGHVVYEDSTNRFCFKSLIGIL